MLSCRLGLNHYRAPLDLPHTEDKNLSMSQRRDHTGSKYLYLFFDSFYIPRGKESNKVNQNIPLVNLYLKL